MGNIEHFFAGLPETRAVLPAGESRYSAGWGDMQQVTLDEAKARLVDLLEAAAAGEEVYITKDEEMSVQLVPRPARKRKRRFGSAKGLISMAPDFDAPLEDFKEYTQ